MAEQSYIFDFSRVPSFFEHFNIDFLVSDMDGTNAKFQLVLVQHGADNISEYLDANGDIDSDLSSELIVQDCKLLYTSDEYGDATIKLADDVTFTIGDTNVPLKAVLLRDKTTGYVMGYSINLVPFSVTNKVVFDEDVIFWDITRLNQYG